MRQNFVEDKHTESFLSSVNDYEILSIKPEFKKYAVYEGLDWGFGRGDLTISDEFNKALIKWAGIDQVFQGIGSYNQSVTIFYIHKFNTTISSIRLIMSV
jgi:hypothetical protein